MTVTAIAFIDYGAQGEYGFFGKKVAETDVRGMTAEEVAAEVAAMHAIVGEHCTAIEIETVGAAA